MWHTPNGDRKLTGAEAQAVRASIGFMIDTLECEGKELAEPWMFDIPVFDNLSWQQRIALLAGVGESLLQDEIPPPELTAVNEAVAKGQVNLPSGYNIFWSGQYEYMQRAKARLMLMVPLTLLIIVLMWMVTHRRKGDES